jgi:AcrR family transcriptional regulator
MKTNDRAHVDKRITSTRNTILDAAISLYRKLGIEKTSISQVIDLSEVGRSTFYRHCSGRDDLLNQVLNRDFDALMLEFQSVSRCYESLEEQIEEDMLWFLEQFIRRPALSLVCSDIKWQRYQQTAESLSAFRRASIACATPTYQRALKEGRLRKGIRMDNYIDWASFVVMSMQVANMPSKKTRLYSRATLKNFLVPSLIKDKDYG